MDRKRQQEVRQQEMNRSKMSNELAVRENGQIVRTYDEVERAAKAMAASGFFTDVKSISQAVVKIMAGQELGFGPFASMNGVYIIQGRPAVGANLMASAVKASGRYNYRVIKMTDKECEIAFFEGGQDIGHSVFTLEDAKKAGTKNLDKFPRNMLFARAMSNGVRWFCPDVMNGSTVYTPEELGADVDQDGNVIIAVEPEPVLERDQELGTKVEPEVEPVVVLPTTPMTIERACTFCNSKGVAYAKMTPEVLEKIISSLYTSLKSEDETDELRKEHTLKLGAAQVIYAAKKDGSIQ